MAWFKVDDGLATHPKVLEAGNAAMGLWVRAGAWAAQQLTDGYVSRSAVNLLGTTEEANALVSAGLWIEFDDGFLFHQWEERQPSRGDVEERRAKNAEKLRKWRERNAARNEVTNEVRNQLGEQNGNPAPDPSRPVPTHISKEVSEVADATRPDVDRLLDLLDEELSRNGVKKLPKRNKANQDAIRLMLDRDGISESDIAGAIRWAQGDEFWRANILSASKLREKYETLRAHASRQNRSGVAVQENLARLAQLEAEERATEQKGLSR